MRIHQQADDEEQRPVRLSFCRSLQRDPQLKCLTLSLLIVLSLASVAWCRIAPRPSLSSRSLAAGSPVGQCQHSGYVYFPVGLFCVLYLVYLGECWHSSTHVSFRFPVDASAIYQQIRAMRLSPPIVWWRAVCYHYDRRLRQVMRYRRGDAYTSSQVFYERVNSQVTTTVFDYTHFGVIDASKRLIHLEKHPATKIRFSRKFSFACPLAEESYNQQRNEFLEEHQRIDDYLDFTDGLDLLNVRFDDQTVALSNPYHRPWYLYTWVFWVASVALLSYPLRIIIGFKTAHVHYQVHKIFGVDRGPEFMTRILVGGDATAGGQGINGVNGVNGGQLETAIRHNLSLAPSYAEALQLSQHRPRFFLDRDFHSYGSIPLLPIADRKSSTVSRILPDALSSSNIITGNHVTGLPAAGDDDVRCFERSRVTRCVVSVARDPNVVTQTMTRKMTNSVDVATVASREQERRHVTEAVAMTSFATAIDGSDEIRPDVMSESGNVEADVRIRRGNDRTVARGQQSDENPDERRTSIAEAAEEHCTTRSETIQEMTAQEVLTQPEIDQHPVDEGDEDEEGNDASGVRRIDEYTLPCEAHRLNRSDDFLFQSHPSVISHLNFNSANHENESLDPSNYLNHHTVNQTGESRRIHHLNHHLNHLHRCVLNPGCESSIDVVPFANDATPVDSDDVDLLDLVNESPPSYEDALRMRRFVLPVATGSGQHFQSQATSVDEFDEDSIESPGGHRSPDYAQADSGDNPSRSRAAVVIQVMETSL